MNSDGTLVAGTLLGDGKEERVVLATGEGAPQVKNASARDHETTTNEWLVDMRGRGTDFQATRFTAVGNSHVYRHLPVATAQSFMVLSAEPERRNSDLAGSQREKGFSPSAGSLARSLESGGEAPRVLYWSAVAY